VKFVTATKLCLRKIQNLSAKLDYEI